jgi:putative transposase
VSAEQMELARLRAELARVKMERDILKKATAYFAKDLCEVRLDGKNKESVAGHGDVRGAGCQHQRVLRASAPAQTSQPSRPGGGRLSNEALLAHIRAIHAEVKGEYGWPRVWKELLARGHSRGQRPGAATDAARTASRRAARGSSS